MFCKPIINAEPETSTPKYPDRLFFEIGEYKFPKFVLTEGEMADVVEKYCEYHGFKLEPKNAPDQR